MTSHGFNADGHYLSSGIKITPEGFPRLKISKLIFRVGTSQSESFFKCFCCRYCSGGESHLPALSELEGS